MHMTTSAYTPGFQVVGAHGHGHRSFKVSLRGWKHKSNVQTKAEMNFVGSTLRQTDISKILHKPASINAPPA